MFFTWQFHSIGKQCSVASLNQAKLVAALHRIDNSSKRLYTRHATGHLSARRKPSEPRMPTAAVAAVGAVTV